MPQVVRGVSQARLNDGYGDPEHERAGWAAAKMVGAGGIRRSCSPGREGIAASTRVCGSRNSEVRVFLFSEFWRSQFEPNSSVLPWVVALPDAQRNLSGDLDIGKDGCPIARK